MTEYSVLDVLLMKKKKYIVLFSGLEFSPVEQITNDLAKDFNAIVLNFIHLDLDDSLDLINKRVNDLLDKKESNPRSIFIISKSFPSTRLKIPADLHLNISLHQIAIQKLDPLKRADLPQKYMDSLKTNRINKYINLKKEYVVDEVENEIFNIIIDDIEKKVYGDQNINKLGSNSLKDTLSKPSEASKLSFNTKVPSLQEKKAEATVKAEEEITDAIEEIEDSISAEKELDESDDFLSDEIRILGSQGRRDKH